MSLRAGNRHAVERANGTVEGGVSALSEYLGSLDNDKRSAAIWGGESAAIYIEVRKELSCNTELLNPLFAIPHL